MTNSPKPPPASIATGLDPVIVEMYASLGLKVGVLPVIEAENNPPEAVQRGILTVTLLPDVTVAKPLP